MPYRFRPRVRSVRFLEHLMESLKGTGRSMDLMTSIFGHNTSRLEINFEGS